MKIEQSHRKTVEEPLGKVEGGGSESNRESFISHSILIRSLQFPAHPQCTSS